MTAVLGSRVPSTMRAVALAPGPDGAVAVLEERPVPEPGPGEILVEVHSAGVNRGELLRRPLLRTGVPVPNGIEFAGVVRAHGAGTSIHTGASVMGHWKGCQAEYVVVAERLVMPVPSSLNLVEAGGWPNMYITAHDALVTNGGFEAGMNVLVHGITSSVGLAAARIAALAGAATVIGTSRSEARLRRAAELTRADGILATERWVDEVRERTGGKGVDVVVDMVGGGTTMAALSCMGVGGTYVSVGRLAGELVEVDLDAVSRDRQRIVGVSFRTRDVGERAACVQACRVSLLDAPSVPVPDVPIAATFPMDAIEDAHAYMSGAPEVGKTVLVVGER